MVASCVTKLKRLQMHIINQNVFKKMQWYTCLKWGQKRK